MKTQGLLYSIKETFVFFFFLISAGSALSYAAVMYGYGEAVGVRISARVQAVLKSKHHRMFQQTIGEDVTQHFGLYNGEVKSFEVSFVYND